MLNFMCSREDRGVVLFRRMRSVRLMRKLSLKAGLFFWVANPTLSSMAQPCNPHTEVMLESRRVLGAELAECKYSYNYELEVNLEPHFFSGSDVAMGGTLHSANDDLLLTDKEVGVASVAYDRNALVVHKTPKEELGLRPDGTWKNLWYRLEAPKVIYIFDALNAVVKNYSYVYGQDVKALATDTVITSPSQTLKDYVLSRTVAPEVLHSVGLEKIPTCSDVNVETVMDESASPTLRVVHRSPVAKADTSTDTKSTFVRATFEVDKITSRSIWETAEIVYPDGKRIQPVDEVWTDWARYGSILWPRKIISYLPDKLSFDSRRAGSSRLILSLSDAPVFVLKSSSKDYIPNFSSNQQF